MRSMSTHLCVPVVAQAQALLVVTAAPVHLALAACTRLVATHSTLITLTTAQAVAALTVVAAALMLVVGVGVGVPLTQ